MGLMDKILDVMKLDPDDDFEYDNEDYDLEPEAPAKSPLKQQKAEEIDFEDRKRTREKVSSRPTNKITPMRSSKNSRGNDMEVCVVRPRSIDDEREITDTLLDGRTVVLNIEGLAVDIAQRIIDFTSGSCYAIGGNLQKISNYIFIITPANVDVSGDFQDLVEGFDVNTFKSEF